MNQFKLIYILLFCIMIAKPISNVISTHENGLPKLVNTYELKSKGLTDAEIANRIIEILDMKLCVGAERLDKASPMPHTISVANK